MLTNDFREENLRKRGEMHFKIRTSTVIWDLKILLDYRSDLYEFSFSLSNNQQVKLQNALNLQERARSHR